MNLENNGLTTVETPAKQKIDLDFAAFTSFCDDFLATELNTLVDFDSFSCEAEDFFNLEVSSDQLYDFDKCIFNYLVDYSVEKGYIFLINAIEDEVEAIHTFIYTFMLVDLETCAKNSRFLKTTESVTH